MHDTEHNAHMLKGAHVFKIWPNFQNANLCCLISRLLLILGKRCEYHLVEETLPFVLNTKQPLSNNKRPRGAKQGKRGQIGPSMQAYFYEVKIFCNPDTQTKIGRAKAKGIMLIPRFLLDSAKSSVTF